MEHIHAELMAQYDEDAKQHTQPWELWQHGDHGVWVDCNIHPGWHTDHSYRRKPRSTTAGEHVNAEILRAIADGKAVQYRKYHPPGWEPFQNADTVLCWKLLKGGSPAEWRIAPETIMIGEYEVPEPCREPPRSGQKFWTVNPFTGPQGFTWDGSKEDHHALKNGFVLLTKEAAEKHYEAFKNLLAKK